MAGVVKFKLGILILSILILVLIPLYKSKFNAPVTIKRWGILSWSDFKGLVPPFTGYGAAISSRVYLEFDSLTSQFRAYAGQNNIQSWAKKSSLESIYLLNHEQYHFNIAELHARLLNEYINANPDKTEAHYRYRLALINGDLSFMQDKYDDETDHSVFVGKQRRWEYKIDSLLLRHSTGSGWVTDYYSGAKVHFTDTPVFATGLLENGAAYRSYTLNKYGMILSFISFRYSSFDAETFNQSLYDFYNQYSMEIKSFQMNTSRYEFDAMVISKDSLNTHCHLWMYDAPFTYQVKAIYSHTTSDTTDFIEIANSFINSFEIVNTDNYWIDKFENATSIITHVDISKEIKDTESDFSYCLTYRTEEQNGFYRGPIYRDDGALLLALDNLKHDDSLLYNNILVLNKDLYEYEPDSVDHIFYIPAERLPKGKMNITFGYILMKDSVQKCYDYYFQSLKVDSPELDSVTSVPKN